MTRTKIVTIARSYLGTPFRHQGRMKGFGVDCVGLLVCVMRECGLQVQDQANYNGLIDAGLLRSKLDAHLVIRANDCSPLPGDVLLLSIGKNPQHIGIATDIGIIHTYEGSGKVVEPKNGSKQSNPP